MSKSTILFVDDEIQILSSLRRELIDSDHKCVFANSAAEALEILDDQVIDVLVSDMKMPKMNGLELLKIAKEKYPTVVRIILSGYTHLPQVIAAINQGYIYKFIPKPWNFDNDLKPAIDDAIAHRKYLKSFFTADKQTAGDSNLSNEVESFKKIIDYMGKTFKYLLQQELSEESRHIIITYFNLLQDIYFEYISTLVHRGSSFKLGKLIDDVKNQFEIKNHNSCHLQLPPDNDDEKTYTGNMKAISYIIVLFLDNLKRYSINDNIAPKIKIDRIRDIEIMSLFLTFPLRKGDVLDLRNTKTRKELNLLYLILQKISELVNATLVISEIQSTVYAKLDIPLIKQEN